MEQFDFERLDAWTHAVEFVVAAKPIADGIGRGHGDLADQLRRASTSIALNLAEGAGEYAPL
jgi:four helix bundle protein